MDLETGWLAATSIQVACLTLNLCSSGRLDQSSLADVYEALISIQHKWRDLGVMLGLESYRLDAISVTARSLRDGLREMLNTWLRVTPAPSWSRIVEALRTEVVDEPRLAQELESQHCTHAASPGGFTVAVCL